MFECCSCSTYDDPALYDPDLKRRLEYNKKAAKNKMDMVSPQPTHPKCWAPVPKKKPGTYLKWQTKITYEPHICIS